MKRFVPILFVSINIFFSLLIIETTSGQVIQLPAEQMKPLPRPNSELMTENQAASIHPGIWTATTGTGFRFEITVNDDASSITCLKLIFNDFKYGIVTRNGSITITSTWGINSQSFQIIYTDYDGDKFTINGEFKDNGIEATGTWKFESSYGNRSGTWNAEPENILPDLAITSIDFWPESGKTDEVLDVNVRVENLSSSPAGSCSLKYYLSDNDIITDGDLHIGTSTVPALAGGESSEESLSWIIPESLATGTYYVGAIIDADYQVDEYDENNDFCLVDPTFGKLEDALPDLILTTVGFDPSEGRVGSSLDLHATVQNIGAADAGASSLAFFLCVDPDISVEDYYIGSAQIPALPPGNTWDAQISWEVDATVPPGSYYMGYQVDEHMDVEESDEWNYYFLPGLQFELLPNPDLQISAMSFSPSSGKSGDDIHISLTIKNNDLGNSGSFSLAYYLSADTIITDSDYLLGDFIVANLDGGKESLLENKWTIYDSFPERAYYVGCIADARNEVTESNEENNVYCIYPDQFIKDNPPQIESMSPHGESQTTADPMPELVLTFNEEIKEGQGCLKIFQILSDGTEKLSREKECWEGKITGKSMKFRLATCLECLASHYILIDPGFVEDLNGNPFEGISEKGTWTFKTGNYPTGISPNAESRNFSIFPNPASDEITIEMTNNQAPFTVEIINLEGQIILSRELESAPYKMHLNDLSKGIYFIRAYNKNFSGTKKLIIH